MTPVRLFQVGYAPRVTPYILSRTLMRQRCRGHGLNPRVTRSDAPVEILSSCAAVRERRQVGAPPLTSDRVTARGGTAPGERVEGHRYAGPTAPRLYLTFKPLLRQRLRWDDPPVNSGPLAQELVRYGLAYLDWITAGFRRSHGVSLAAAGCSPGESVAAEVQRRERQAAHLHRDAGGVNGRGGNGRDALRWAARVWPLPVGHRLQSLGHRRGHDGRRQLFGGPVMVIGSLFGSALVGMIDNGLSLAGLDESSGRSWSASSSSRSRWRRGHDG
jgi:hypothetical protein